VPRVENAASPCVLHTANSCIGLSAICIQHSAASTLLIDVLNPGSRESEIRVVVVVSCFASAISLDVPALDHRPLMLVRYMRSIECESGDGIDEVLEVTMDGL
jgi:hypothetical protein